jgi:hypothetical protein
MHKLLFLPLLPDDCLFSDGCSTLFGFFGLALDLSM